MGSYMGVGYSGYECERCPKCGVVCGDGSGYGCGDGSGGNLGIKMFNGITVYAIDNTPTLIYRAHGNNAQGAILNGDLTLTPCAVVKSNNTYAHGESLRAAYADLADKLFTDMPDDKRIAAFLTGSCETGRLAFAREHDIDLESGAMTVEEFVQLTGNAYGGDIIRSVAKHYTHTANPVKGGR